MMISVTARGMQDENRQEFNRQALLQFMQKVTPSALQQDPTMRALMKLGCKYSLIHQKEFEGHYGCRNGNLQPEVNDFTPIFVVREGCQQMINSLIPITTEKGFTSELNRFGRLIDEQYTATLSDFSKPSDSKDHYAAVKARTASLLRILIEKFDIFAADICFNDGSDNVFNSIICGTGYDYYVRAMDSYTGEKKYPALEKLVIEFERNSRALGFDSNLVRVTINKRHPEHEYSNPFGSRSPIQTLYRAGV